MDVRQQAVCLGLVAFMAFGSCCGVTAKDALDRELEAMATQQVIPLVNKRGGGALAVGGFTAAASVKGNSGPELQLKLAAILQDAGAVVNADQYRYEITGNYLPYNDRKTGLQGVKLVSRLVDAEDGTTLGEFPRFVFGPEAVPRMLGLSVSTRGSSDPKVQSIAFRKAIERPKTFVVNHQVASTPASPYSVQVLVQRGASYRSVDVRKDSRFRPYVDLKPDDIYAVRLVNASDHEAAVALSIDGINVFQFSQQDPKPKYWIVPAKKNGQPGITLVRGWDKDSAHSLEFKVVDFPKSAAAAINLRPSSNIGVISASFATCWQHEKDRPRSEGRTRATGFGKEVTDAKQRTKRHVGQLRDVISIRYERDNNDTLAVIP